MSTVRFPSNSKICDEEEQTLTLEYFFQGATGMTGGAVAEVAATEATGEERRVMATSG